MSMKNTLAWGCEKTRAIGLEVWFDEDQRLFGLAEAIWWEVRKNGVCLAKGGGSDEAPDAAVTRLYYAECDARDRREAMIEAGMF